MLSRNAWHRWWAEGIKGGRTKAEGGLKNIFRIMKTVLSCGVGWCSHSSHNDLWPNSSTRTSVCRGWWGKRNEYR